MFRHTTRTVLLLLALLPFFAITLLASGTDVENWVDFVFGWPANNGAAGGVLPFIINSLLIVFPAVALSVAIALPCALLLQISAYSHSILVRAFIETGACVPRLIWGVAGSIFFGSLLGLGISVATGILTLACLLSPLLATNFLDALSAERDKYLLTCRALGLSDWKSWTNIILPEAWPGLKLAMQAALARALSDAAALYLTAGATARLVSGLDAPASTLAVQVLMQLLEIGGGQKQAYATSLVLLSLVFAVQAPLILSRLGKRK